MKTKTNILYISHGGGPLPLLGDSGHKEMVQCLRQIADTIEKPEAILVVSAHWEALTPRITAAESPQLLYDYYGFPDEAYEITYSCEGNPTLARDLHTLLRSAGFDPALDAERGFDHGLFIPLSIMYPDADIPCVQLSLISDLDPEGHINLGRALQKLDQNNLLIVGSGFSFHNMSAFFSSDSADCRQKNEVFEEWLVDVCTSQKIDEAARTNQLEGWERAPAARYCHPREEHLLPLHVCYGAADAPAARVWQLDIMGKQASMYLWQG